MDSKKHKMKIVAYLAPEIPALSATFVYQEIKALQARGVRVLPFSVRFPGRVASEETALIENTMVLYQGNYFLRFARALKRFGRLPGKKRAFKWLISDMRDVGWLSVTSLKLVQQFAVSAVLGDKMLRTGVSHLHVHFAHVPTQIGMYASAFSAIPFTVTAHANDIFERGLLLKKKAERAKKFLTISEYNKNFLVSLGLPEEKINIIRCGSSLSFVDDMPRVDDKHEYMIGTLGRLVEKKGIDILINALACDASKKYKVKLLIAGDGPLLGDLIALVKRLNMGDSIEFLGALHHTEVANFLDSLDLFVLPCVKDKNGDMDGIPVVLMEAMARGVPVISTRLSGIPELVINGTTGLLAEPGDVQGLGALIAKNLEEKIETARMQGNAFTHVRNEFSLNANVEKLIQCWEVN